MTRSVTLNQLSQVANVTLIVEMITFKSDLQKLILLNVEDDLLEMEPQLQILSSVLSTVDVLMSLGVLAAEQNLVKPEIVEASVVMIRGGRHLVIFT